MPRLSAGLLMYRIRDGAMFPEMDRAEWFDVGTARNKIHAGQEALIEQLEAIARCHN